MDEALAAYLAAVDARRRSGDDPELIGRIVPRSPRWAPVGRCESRITRSPAYSLVQESLGRNQRSTPRRAVDRLKWSRGRVPRPRVAHRWPAKIAKPAGSHRRRPSRSFAGQDAPDPTLQYRAYDVLSLLYWHAGETDNYRKVTELEAELIEQLPSRRDRLDVLIGMVDVRMDEGHYRAALELAEQAFAESDGLSLHERMHIVPRHLGVGDAG